MRDSKTIKVARLQEGCNGSCNPLSIDTQSATTRWQEWQQLSQNPWLRQILVEWFNIGVSFDNDHKKWTAAIEKDGLPWIQISALKKWQCKSAKLYDVKSVPHTVILDSENRIIARNVRGEELEKLIAQILDAQ